MKKVLSNITIILILILLSCFNCSFKKNKQTREIGVLTTGYVHFNSNIDSLLRSFVQNVKYKNCYFEMYIDKRDTSETVICLRASMNYPRNTNDNKELLNDYLKCKNPALYTNVDGIIFFIYTGIEDLIDTDHYDNGLVLNKDSSSYYEYQWVIQKVNSRYKKYENIAVWPFDKKSLKVIEFK